MSNLYRSGAAVAALALAAGFAASAQAQEFTAANGDKVTFYGQLNLGYVGFDDGSKTHNHAGNISNSTSKLGFTYDHDMEAGKLQFRFETGLGIASSGAYSQDNKSPEAIDWDKSQLRKVELSFASNFGTVYVGQGSMATDGVGELDDSNTSIAGYPSYGDVAGAYYLRDKHGNLTDVTIGDAFHDTDGGRRLRVRYDTPEFGGFTLSSAYGKEVLTDGNHNKYYDAALKWKGEYGDFKIQAAAGAAWTEYDDGTGTQGQSVASATITHASGVNFTVGGGSVYAGGGEWEYAKLGYTANWISAGATSIATEYMHTSDYTDDNGRGHSVGVMAVQNIAALSTDVYAGYRSYDYSDANTSYKDSQSLLVGARWKF